ncbi:hypothetical protein OG896_24685 [Streptomyces sp. NBC_00669]|uniref:hypothetical protein n=1 Tax=Streptomyces sp. NBC_00669 TaxID=2976011 RepID=UPI002E34DDBB|nr:hypothetical protein [Streptomyces sp. NBC_00669]
MNHTLLTTAAAVSKDAGFGPHMAGAITLSGIALATSIVMLAGLRGNRRVKFLHNSETAAAWALFTGTSWMAAGGSWANAATGIASLPTSILGTGGGNYGAGGIALAITLISLVFEWKKRIIPTILGISAAVTYASAGGIWGTLVNALRTMIARVTGAA